MQGGELALLYFVVPVAPGRSRLMSLPLATNPSFRCAYMLSGGTMQAAPAVGLAARAAGPRAACVLPGTADYVNLIDLHSSEPVLLSAAGHLSQRRGLSKLFHWQPWLRHLYNHTVAAQDIAVLHRQVGARRGGGGGRPPWVECAGSQTGRLNGRVAGTVTLPPPAEPCPLALRWARLG